MLNRRQRLRVKTLVLVPKAVTIAQILEGMGDDDAKGLAEHPARLVVLGQAAGPQIHRIHAAIGILQRRRRRAVRGDLAETRIGLQPQRLPRLVQRAQAQIAAALDIDRGQIHRHRRHIEEIAQILNNMHIQRIGEIAREVPQQARRPAISGKTRRCLEKRILEAQGRADISAILRHLLQIGRDDGMAKAEGRTGEFLADGGIHIGLIAGIGGHHPLPQQMGEEFIVSDMGNLGGDDGLGLLIQLITRPIRMLGRQPVHLKIMLAHKEHLQGGEVRILGRAAIARGIHAIDDGQVVASAGQHMAIGAAQARRRGGV